MLLKEMSEIQARTLTNRLRDHFFFVLPDCNSLVFLYALNNLFSYSVKPMITNLVRCEIALNSLTSVFIVCLFYANQRLVVSPGTFFTVISSTYKSD